MFNHLNKSCKNLGGTKIYIADTIGNLTDILNSTLTWYDHISQACGRVYSRRRNLRVTQYFTQLKI